MLEQLANTLTFFAFFVASKVGKTGLADVTVDVWEITKAGTATEVVTAAPATEVGDGIYRYILASGSVDAEGEYIAVFKTADATVDAKHIPAIWTVSRAGVENLDATVSSRLSDKADYALSAAGVDAILDEVVEGTLTMRQMLKLFTAALAGKASGGGTATIAFRDVADSKPRITLTVDANGDRSAVVLDGA